MSEYLPDVEQAKTLVEEFERWNDVTGAIPNGIGWYYECRSILEDGDKKIADLTESLRQQESNLRTALDELRQPAGNPFDKSKAVFAGKSKDGYLLKCWFESQEDLDAAFDVVERLPVTTEAPQR